jgi:hypothetical protein
VTVVAAGGEEFVPNTAAAVVVPAAAADGTAVGVRPNLRRAAARLSSLGAVASAPRSDVVGVLPIYITNVCV